jgi:DNA-binding NarL/FixJ family response regulator
MVLNRGGAGTARMNRGAPALSPRELEVAKAVALGWRNRRIGEALGITERTVKKHVASARAKLGAQSRVELALLIGGTPRRPVSRAGR